MNKVQYMKEIRVNELNEAIRIQLIDLVDNQGLELTTLEIEAIENFLFNDENFILEVFNDLNYWDLYNDFN